MGALAKIIIKVAANTAALWVASVYISGFVITGGFTSLVLGGIVLAGITLVIKPILKLISLPFLVITLGAFYIIIYMVLLAIADFLLPQLTITGFSALLWGALLIGVVNTIVH